MHRAIMAMAHIVHLTTTIIHIILTIIGNMETMEIITIVSLLTHMDSIEDHTQDTHTQDHTQDTIIHTDGNSLDIIIENIDAKINN